MLTGGCQCGAVRFTVTGAPGRMLVCYCRMCQRATGNVLAPLVEIENHRLTWDGAPSEYASSNIAVRGFCRDCGTPLYYRQVDREATELMVGTISGGPDIPPVGAYFAENCPSWAKALGTLEARTLDEIDGLVAYQGAE